MSDETAAQDVVVQPAAGTSQRVTIEQFVNHFAPQCHRYLLAGFAHTEKTAERLFDTVEAYAARLEQFHYTPLG